MALSDTVLDSPATASTPIDPRADLPTAPATASSGGTGTRQRLDHVDAMRPVKQAGVVSTHTLLAFAGAGTGVTVGACLQLLHVTREAFLFVSACMLAYSCQGLVVRNWRTFYRRRFSMVAIPFLAWTVIYFVITQAMSPRPLWTAVGHFLYLCATGYYQLYYLIVLLQFYLLFPLFLWLVRKTAGHHATLMVVSLIGQVAYTSLMHWNVLPWAHEDFWASREVISYQFYLVAGLVVAAHLDDVHAYLCAHAKAIVAFTFAAAGLAEAWYYLAQYDIVRWFGSSSDPFQPVVVPFNIGAIACIYLIGVALVRPKSPALRAAVRSGSDNAYGIYLAQMVFILGLGGLGWARLDEFIPWPIVCVGSVALVFGLCIALTAVLARTPLARQLTGRTRVPWPTLARRVRTPGAEPSVAD